MAANVPLELLSQLESKNARFEGVLVLLQNGPAGESEPNLCGQCFLQPDASSQAELGVPVPGPNISPRAEGHQPSCSPVQELSIAVVAASAVGATGGEAAAAASDRFHKCSLTVHGGF